jgi:hypothetical protein
MSRRLAIVLLTAFVALSGRAVCARGVGTCLAFRPARHDCCRPQVGVSAHTCCCAVARASDVSGAVELRTEHVHRVLAAGPCGMLPSAADPDCRARADACARRLRALGPPDTPLDRHDTLLL